MNIGHRRRSCVSLVLGLPSEFQMHSPKDLRHALVLMCPKHKLKSSATRAAPPPGAGIGQAEGQELPVELQEELRNPFREVAARCHDISRNGCDVSLRRISCALGLPRSTSGGAWDISREASVLSLNVPVGDSRHFANA